MKFGWLNSTKKKCFCFNESWSMFEILDIYILLNNLTQNHSMCLLCGVSEWACKDGSIFLCMKHTHWMVDAIEILLHLPNKICEMQFNIHKLSILIKMSGFLKSKRLRLVPDSVYFWWMIWLPLSLYSIKLFKSFRKMLLHVYISWCVEFQKKKKKKTCEISSLRCFYHMTTYIYT